MSKLLSYLPNSIARRLEGRSSREIVSMTLKTLRDGVTHFGPSAIRIRREDGAFDRRWHTDTGGKVNLSALGVARHRAVLGNGYQASNGRALEQCLAVAGIDPGQYTFIDYGSGKGRVVLIAATLGFAHTIGVEFAPELHEVAERNAALFEKAGGAARRSEMILGDAGSYEPPEGPLFAYIYNAFGPVILREALERLEARAAAGQTIVALYVNPRHRETFEENGRWRIVEAQNDWILYHPAA